MNYCTILKKCEEYVRAYMLLHMNTGLYYHNLTHTEKVVAAARQIASHYQLSDEDIFIIITACWFHDIGHHKTMNDHELASALEAGTFLKNYAIDEETVKAVQECITATRLPQNPHNLLEQVICDADLFHLGTEQFMEESVKVKREIEAVHDITLGEAEWWNTTACFFESHYYHTGYCKNMLNTRKRYNLEMLKIKVEEQKGALLESVC